MILLNSNCNSSEKLGKSSASLFKNSCIFKISKNSLITINSVIFGYLACINLSLNFFIDFFNSLILISLYPQLILIFL